MTIISIKSSNLIMKSIIIKAVVIMKSFLFMTADQLSDNSLEINNLVFSKNSINSFDKLENQGIFYVSNLKRIIFTSCQFINNTIGKFFINNFIFTSF